MIVEIYLTKLYNELFLITVLFVFYYRALLRLQLKTKVVLNMVFCTTCDREFKNKHSLSNHKRNFHGKKDKTDKHPTKRRKVIYDEDSLKSKKDNGSQTEYESENSEVDSQTSIENHSDPGSNPGSDPESDPKSDPGSDLHESGTDSDTESEPTEDSDDDIPQLRLKTNYKMCTENPKLIKKLCQQILDGTIPLEEHHVKDLKPIRNFIRKVAGVNLRIVRKTIENEIKREKKTGNSNLRHTLKTVIPRFDELYH